MKNWKKKYPGVIKCIVMIFFNEVAGYCSLAILALFLSSKVGVIPASFLVALPALVGTSLGMTSVSSVKCFGIKNSLLISSIFAVVGYLGYLVFSSIHLLFICSVFLGLSRALWQPISKTYCGIVSNELDSKSDIYKIRYLTICVGAVTGPLLTLTICQIGNLFHCILASMFIYISLALFLKVCFNGNEKEPNSFSGNAGNDTVHSGKQISTQLLGYVLVGFLVFVVFSQFETVYSLYLNVYFNKAENIYSVLLILNSLFCIIIQVLSIKSNKILDNKMSLIGGIGAFIVSFYMFSFATNNLILYIIAVFIYSIGEVFSIPALDIRIDALSNDETRTRNFALAEIRGYGFFIGPIFAGTILNIKGSAWMSLSSVLILIVVIIIILSLHRNDKANNFKT